MKTLLRSILAILIVSFLLPSSAVMAQSPLSSHLFWGTVTLDGAPAPNGTSVTATMGGANFGTTTGSVAGKGDDYYELTINGTNADAGKTINFYVNGLSAGSATFEPLGFTPLDLSATTPPPQYTLTMAVGTGNGTTSPAPGSYDYDEDTVVNITAIAAGGWQFDNWSGDVANPNSASTTVTMDADKTATANFIAAPDVTLTMAVNGNGSTTPAVGIHSYPKGTVVNITAIAASGWQFDNWTGSVANSNSATTTVTMDANKTVTANFSLEEDTTPPLILAISVSNITKSGTDISWTTNEPSDSQVEYWSSPGELTPLDETLVTKHLVRLRDLTPATTYYYKVMSRDEAGNLAVSGEYTFTTMGLPATFTTSDWAVSLREVDTGTEATISFLVTNTGDLAGSYQVTIAVNGGVEATKEVTLDAGTSEGVTFTTIKDVAGTYLVSVNGLTVSFTVTEEAPPPAKEINWWLIAGIIAGVVLLLILIILLTTRAKEKAKKGPEKEPGEKVTEKAKTLVSTAVRWIYHRQPLETKEAKEKTKREAASPKERAKREAKEAKKAREAERKARQEVEREAKEKTKREAEETKKAIEAEEKARLEAERVAGEKARREAAEAKEIYVEMKEGGGGVLTVTALAVEKLKEAIRTQTTDPGVGIRLMPSPLKPNQFEMALDKEREGDQVVESEGLKILLLRPELAPALEEMFIDCQETPQGVRFTMSKLTPST